MENKLKMIWDNNVSIGNKEIDQEHSKLFDIYQELIDFIETKGSRSEFARILSRMTDYSLIHFKKEEKYMQQMGYPKFADHQKYHMNYIRKVAMYNVELLSADPPDPQEITDFLGKWWINHILKMDVEYENYRNDIKSEIQYQFLPKIS